MVLAHAGDWIANLAYSAPALIIIIGLVIAKVRERRADREEAIDPPGHGDPPDAPAKSSQRAKES